jgi:hypothetical protein
MSVPSALDLLERDRPISGGPRISNPGLYLHQQPCQWTINLFPEGRGIGWLCLARYFEDVPVDERDYDLSFIAIEGDTNALHWLKEAFIRASEGRSLAFSADELQEVLGSVPFNLDIIRSN